MERVLAASTLPALLLGGEVSADQDAAFEPLAQGAADPVGARRSCVGRTLLFPPDDDVGWHAVDAAVGLVREVNGMDDKLYLPAWDPPATAPSPWW